VRVGRFINDLIVEACRKRTFGLSVGFSEDIFSGYFSMNEKEKKNLERQEKVTKQKMAAESKAKEERKLVIAGKKEAEPIGRIIEPAGMYWRAHRKYLYEALNAKEAELSVEEKRSLLLNPPLILTDKVKLYLDAESVWYKRRVEYLGKMKITRAIRALTRQTETAETTIEEKKKDEPMKSIKYESQRQKRKRFRDLEPPFREEPKAKRAKTSALSEKEEEISEEQWGRFTDELENKYKLNPSLIDEMGEKIDKWLEPTFKPILNRTHTSAYEDQIGFETQKRIQELNENSKNQEKLQTIETQSKQEKKQLRQVMLIELKVMAAFERDVIEWLLATNEQEFELDDGKLFLTKQQQTTKLTKRLVRQAAIDSISTKGSFSQARNVVNLVEMLLRLKNE
jgi:hypothetical protein